MNKEIAFDAKIKPLAETLAKACNLYGIAMVAAFHTPNGEKESQGMLMAIPDGDGDTPSRFKSAMEVLVAGDASAQAAYAARFPAEEEVVGGCGTCEERDTCANADKDDEKNAAMSEKFVAAFKGAVVGFAFQSLKTELEEIRAMTTEASYARADLAQKLDLALGLVGSLEKVVVR